MSIELHELRGFVALAQALNYRIAAGALHISQPALPRLAPHRPIPLVASLVDVVRQSVTAA